MYLCTPTHSIAEAVRSTAADARLQTTFSRPLLNQPADDDTEMTGPTIEGEITHSSEVETALDRLLRLAAGEVLESN